MRMTRTLLALSALAAATPALADEPASPAAARLKGDVAYLADDAREGRAPGTSGIEAAADYVAAAFKKAGLKPAAGAEGYFQPFTLAGGPKLGPASMVEVAGLGDEALKARPEVDYVSLSSRSAEVKGAPMAFAGYGITAKDEGKKLDYDDYKDLDVKGKAIILLRGEPQLNDPKSPFDGTSASVYGTLRRKATNAAEHGAVMVVLVNAKAGLKGAEDSLLPDGEAGRLPVPMVMATRAGVDDFLARAGKPKMLEELEQTIDASLTPASFPIDGPKLTAKLELTRPRLNTKNVVGVLEGAGPHAEETIVVGAHYDHIGRGGMNSLAFGSHEIHNGADDNASGTAMVMELARRLAARPEPLPRRVVFMAFSGEEEGLLGSAYYAAHPLYPLKDTAVMVNFDMVGRLNPESELTIFGAGTVEGLGELVDSLGKSQGLKVRRVAGTGGEFSASDHYSFYTKNVPVLFAFTGNHPQYHKPGDDIELINANGMARIADVGELVLLDLARRPDRPAFAKLVNQKPAGPSPGATRTGSGAYLGTRPAYGESDTPGVKLDGVSEGSPAEKAGLKGGDIIIKFAGKDVKNIEDYMEAIGTKKPGDMAEVVVKRDGKEQTIGVTLGIRPGGN